jgi:hypothetical protein
MKGLENAELKKIQAMEPADDQQKDRQKGVPATVDPGDRWYEQIFKKTREWFETEPDTDI